MPDTDSEGEEELDDIFTGLSVAQLKAHCRRRQLQRSGTKKVLLSRLREYERELMTPDDGVGSVSEEKSVDYSDSSGEDECVDVNNSSGEDECTDDTDSSVEDQFEGLTVVQLKEHCRRRNIRYGGTKKVLLGRLREYERTKDDDDESVGEEDDGDEAVEEEDDDDESMGEGCVGGGEKQIENGVS